MKHLRNNEGRKQLGNFMYEAQGETVKNQMKIHGSTVGYFSSVAHVVNDLFVISSVINKEIRI